MVKELMSKINTQDISVFKIVPSNNSLVSLGEERAIFLGPDFGVETDLGLIDEEVSDIL